MSGKTARNEAGRMKPGRRPFAVRFGTFHILSPKASSCLQAFSLFDLALYVNPTQKSSPLQYRGSILGSIFNVNQSSRHLFVSLTIPQPV